MLSTEERLLARQFNLRSRQLFWRGIVPESHPAWHMDEESLVDWVCDYQSKHRLLVDGCFGPSTLIVMLAESRGGLGGFIIDGKEVIITRDKFPESLDIEIVDGVILNDYLYAIDEDLVYASAISSYLGKPINVAP